MLQDPLLHPSATGQDEPAAAVPLPTTDLAAFSDALVAATHEEADPLQEYQIPLVAPESLEWVSLAPTLISLTETLVLELLQAFLPEADPLWLVEQAPAIVARGQMPAMDLVDLLLDLRLPLFGGARHNEAVAALTICDIPTTPKHILHLSSPSGFSWS